jgi:hypothetical protein
MIQTSRTWPELPLDQWQDTYRTLHMWTQMVGKICLALTPRTNHYWNAAFQVNARGLNTPLMTYQGRSVTMVFDFLQHEFQIICADVQSERIPLRPISVAQFYYELMERLRAMSIDVRIWKMPVEVQNPTPFDQDEANYSYDPDKVGAFHQALLSMKPVLEDFRCDFIGKCSPVHFFWGGFDLAVTRFSGRRAPPKPELGEVYAESYSHEVISHGFWPGGGWPTGGYVSEPMFYAYSVPEPKGFSDSKVEPSEAYYDKSFSEFFLPYEAVRRAASPEKELMRFMETTYDLAANLASWDRANLER